jgi:hypothetical protein
MQCCIYQERRIKDASDIGFIGLFSYCKRSGQPFQIGGVLTILDSNGSFQHP